MNAVVDMSAFIAPKSDQMNADDLIGGPRTITVTRVSASPESPEQPVSIYFDGDDGKPFKPCKSMRRVMVAIWGSDASKYVGRSMTLYRDPKVAFGGMQVGGIRISHMTDMDREVVIALTATRAKRAPYKVMPLKVEQRQAQQPEGMTAEKWAVDHIAFVAGSADLERLAHVQNSGKKAMDKLINSHPELHAKVQAAYDKRFAELSEPATGRADTDFGDRFPGDDADLSQHEGN